MNVNIGIQHQGMVAWTGVASVPIDIRKHVYFGFSFKASADILVDAVFNFEAAPPSAADDCVPGTFVPVPEISICDFPAVPGPQATVTIPAGTKAGTVCSGTLPCKPDAFLRLTAASGDTAKLSVVAILSGPK